MNPELKKKRGSKGFHFYPVRRKKKKTHVQWMAYDRVVVDWGALPSLYYIFHIHNRGWWACLPDHNCFDNIEAGGEYYRPIYPIDFYDGTSGDVVYGYIGVIARFCLSIYKGRFVFVKNPMIPGHDLTHVLNIKWKINLEKYKKFEIWKTE